MQTQVVVFLVMAITFVVVLLLIRNRRGIGIALVTDSLGNEVIVTKAAIRQEQMLFLIDTAYAGAPVLSTSYLSHVEGMRRTRTTKYARDLQATYRSIVESQAPNPTPNVDMNDSPLGVATSARALASFIRRTGCRTYTSGCTMRLMGIGHTTEAQTDLLLCSDVAFGIGGGPLRTSSSEVFVTHPLPSSVHILTMDFLMHRSPCVLMPARGRAMWTVDDTRLHSSFVFLTPTFVGGAVRVPMVVGGTQLNIVIDTGAAAALSLASGTHVASCRTPSLQLRATQTGVNGEKVCSDAFFANVQIGTLDMGEVQVFSNSHAVEGADGYAGMGLLRALDMWLAPNEVGFRYSGLSTRTSGALTEGRCENSALPHCAVSDATPNESGGGGTDANRAENMYSLFL